MELQIIGRLAETNTNLEKINSLEAEKHNLAIVLSLEVELQDVVLELETCAISGGDGEDKITMFKLIYNKDELSEKYNALESFEKYRNSYSTSIPDSLTEFKKSYNKTKSYANIWSDDLLAYRLLKSANLSDPDWMLSCHASVL